MEVKLYVLKVIINQLASIYRTTFSKWFPGIGMDKIKKGRKKLAWKLFFQPLMYCKN